MRWIETSIGCKGKKRLDCRLWIFFLDFINLLRRWDHKDPISWYWIRRRGRGVVDNKIVIFIRRYIFNIFTKVHNGSLLDNLTSFEILKSNKCSFVFKLIIESINSFISKELNKISHILFWLKILNILRTEINAFPDLFFIQNNEIFIFILYCF